MLVYQHHFDEQAPGDVCEAKLQARHTLLVALDRTLRSIPHRHALLILGDFNTHLDAAPPCCPLPDPSGHTNSNAVDLAELLSSHSLRMSFVLRMAARTPRIVVHWDKRQDHAQTYVITRAGMLRACSTVRAEWLLPFLITK